MHTPNPHHRIEAIQQALAGKTLPIDPLTRTMVEALTGAKPDAILEYVWGKYCAPLDRTILEAFLIADTDYEDIARATGVPLPAIQAYAEHIFDMSVFRDRLERISYVQRQRGYLTVNQQAYLEAALLQGGRYLAWMVNPNAVTVTPREALETALADGHFVGLTHRGAAPDSERAKHAKSWQQSSVQAATTLMRLDPRDEQEAYNDLAMAILHAQLVDSAETAGALPPHDIIH